MYVSMGLFGCMAVYVHTYYIYMYVCMCVYAYLLTNFTASFLLMLSHYMLRLLLQLEPNQVEPEEQELLSVHDGCACRFNHVLDSASCY